MWRSAAIVVIARLLQQHTFEHEHAQFPSEDVFGVGHRSCGPRPVLVEAPITVTVKHMGIRIVSYEEDSM